MVEGNPTGELGEIVAGLSKGDKTTTDISKVIPFNQVISTLRRKKILNMLAEKDLHKEEIYKTLGAYTKLLNRQRNYRHKKNPTTTKESKFCPIQKKHR